MVKKFRCENCNHVFSKVFPDGKAVDLRTITEGQCPKCAMPGDIKPVTENQGPKK